MSTIPKAAGPSPLGEGSNSSPSSKGSPVREAATEFCDWVDLLQEGPVALRYLYEFRRKLRAALLSPESPQAPGAVDLEAARIEIKARREAAKAFAEEKFKKDPYGPLSFSDGRLNAFTECLSILASLAESPAPSSPGGVDLEAIAPNLIELTRGEPHEDEDCPGDDTCRCANIRTLNAECKALQAALSRSLRPVPAPEGEAEDAWEVAAIRQILAHIAEFGHPMQWDGPMPKLAEEVYGDFAALYEERDALRAKVESLEAALADVSRRLENGTLHIGFCNGNHDKEVGAEGMICNCYLGRVINGLRHRAQVAEAKLRAPAPECPTLAAIDKTHDAAFCPHCRAKPAPEGVVEARSQLEIAAGALREIQGDHESTYNAIALLHVRKAIDALAALQPVPRVDDDPGQDMKASNMEGAWRPPAEPQGSPPEVASACAECGVTGGHRRSCSMAMWPGYTTSGPACTPEGRDHG